MRTIEISQADYIVLAEKEESHFFDHKARAISGKKIQKIATAFANADGGDFIIGIADVSETLFVDQRWEGSIPESFNGHLQALNEIKPSLQADYTFLKCQEKMGAFYR